MPSVKSNDKAKPAPPKKALTGFFIYKQEVYEQTKKENPEAKMTDLTKIISEQWRSMDESTRKKYDRKSEEAKEKYQDEVRAYEEKYGKIEKKKKRRDDDDRDNKKNKASFKRR